MRYALAYLCTFLTGLTGLVYQVTWHKYLSFYLGSHAMATSLVLAVFFLFLSLGYSLIGRNIHRIPIRNRLFLYGLIEGAIGAYVLVSPQLYHQLVALMPAGGASATTDFYLGFVFCALFIGFPTLLMGATIPVLIQALSRSFGASHGTHALVYGLNTLGAVLGALLTGFVFIDTWGLPLTLLYTAFVNLGIAFVTWLMFKRAPDDFQGVTPQQQPEKQSREDQGWWLWLLFGISFLSGFYVFSLENLMIRVAGLTLGSSSYTFAMIVAAFVFGIAAGSLWVGRRRVTDRNFFFWVQLATVLSLAALYFSVPFWPEWLTRIRTVFAGSFINIPLYWTAVFVFLTLILLVPVGLMGMNLPLLFNYLRSRSQHLSHTAGRLYAINTLGSVLGSMLGGYYLFLFFRWGEVFKINMLLVGVTLLMILFAGKPLLERWKQKAGLALVLMISVLWLPAWDDSRFVPGAASIQKVSPVATSVEPTMRRLRDSYEVTSVYHGAAAHVAVAEKNDYPALFINGNPNTGKKDVAVRAMNALYPLGVVEKPRDVFVVGLGGGLSTSIFAESPSVQSVQVAEIAKGVIDALPQFDEQNDNFTQQPYFEKVNMIPSDAFKVLKGSEKQFDIIVSEPNHPWVSGVENLFSREFLQVVSQRLAPQGVYCQWFPLFDVQPGTVMIILNTVRQSFDHVRVFSVADGVLSIMASNSPLRVDANHMETIHERYKTRLPEGPLRQSPFYWLSTELLTNWGVSSVTEDYEFIQSLEFPVVASSSSKARFAGLRVSYYEAIAQRLDVPTSADQPSADFLYEQVPGALDESFFDTALRAVENRNMTARSLKPRLWAHSLQYESEQADAYSQGNRQVYKYLMGEMDALPAELEKSMRKMQVSRNAASGDGALDSIPQELTLAWQLLDAYRTLTHAQVTARIGPVVEAVPVPCEGEACLGFKRMVLIAVGQDGLADLDLTVPDNARRVRRLFRELASSAADSGA